MLDSDVLHISAAKILEDNEAEIYSYLQLPNVTIDD